MINHRLPYDYDEDQDSGTGTGSAAGTDRCGRLQTMAHVVVSSRDGSKECVSCGGAERDCSSGGLASSSSSPPSSTLSSLSSTNKANYWPNNDADGNDGNLRARKSFFTTYFSHAG